MLLAAHINVATLAENEQGKTGKHNESDNNFPHTISFKKKAPTEGAAKRSRQPSPEQSTQHIT